MKIFNLIYYLNLLSMEDNNRTAKKNYFLRAIGQIVPA